MLTTIDLFCGAGGITEGFRQAGFNCLYGNDVNDWALKTFSLNHPNAIADNRGVEIDPSEIRERLDLKPGDLDVLCGGPPCQGFSINAPERFLDDPRNSLFKRYVKFLREFMPKSFVIENVPGMLSLAGGKILNQIIKELHKLGYSVSYKVLFAAHYGVPQERWRLIILGSMGETAPEHPVPSHYALGRANFTRSRELTFRPLDLEILNLKSAVTVAAALEDLPRLEMGEGAEEMEYDSPAKSAYSKEMRKKSKAVFNHFASKLSPQNAERMRYVKPGGSWRDIPNEFLPPGMQRARRSDHTKRYGRLSPTGLASTVMTKCDPHWGTVFLPDQDRVLTVREAARLQSFPDRYRFLGPRVSQYEQVGNAVPCLMARAIGESVKQYLEKNCDVATVA